VDSVEVAAIAEQDLYSGKWWRCWLGRLLVAALLDF